MKSKIVLIALALFSAQASAEWTYVGQDSAEAKYYSNKSSTKMQGGHTLIWELSSSESNDLEINGKKYQSIKALSVYDCKQITLVVKTVLYYDGQMGNGNVVTSATNESYKSNFKDVVPGSMGELMFKVACGGDK